MLGDQRQIRIHRVADGGKHAAFGNHQIARDAGGFGQLDPLFDAAGRARLAIVIDDAFAPGAAELRRIAASQDQSVFDGDGLLIVVAVEGPSLELAARQLSLRASGDETGAGGDSALRRRRATVPPAPRRSAGVFWALSACSHTSISIPSRATSHPASRTSA